MTRGLSLADNVAIITGAGRNVGRGIAETFAQYGASVVINDIDRDRAEQTVQSLATSDGQHHLVHIADVTEQSVVEEMADRIVSEYGALDILVNNVAYAPNFNVFDLPMEEFQKSIDLNLTSTFLCTKYLGTVISDSGGGSIINLSSRLGHRAKRDKFAYCMAKGAIVNLTRQLALDCAQLDIRVNSISPGMVGDPVGFAVGREDRDPSVVPLERLGIPEDIGHAALFLASDLADYITGIDLAVDGGRSV